MQILKLLQGLYLELRTFNENMESFSCLEKERKRRQENPMDDMTDVERFNFKLWIDKRLQEKNISFASDTHNNSTVRSFLGRDTKQITKTARSYLSAVLVLHEV